MDRSAASAVALLAALLAAFPLAAQQVPSQGLDTALANSQSRLIEIRRQREQLEDEMARLRSRVHSLSSEVQNMQAQVQTTGRIVGELDLQIAEMGTQIERKTADLLIAEDALAEKRAILQHRLLEIYKRGPLYTAQVLLAAESFGDLLSRYKYLYLISRQDRQLVREVQALRDSAADGRDQLLSLQNTLSRRRDERAMENQRYRDLEQDRQRSLRQSQRAADRAQQQLAQLARDEARLNDFIAALERRRLAEASRGVASASRLRTSDIGQLDWPVNGNIVYRFGRQLLPNNTTIRWNGIGIGVSSGTPVHTVAPGTVRLARSLGTYGPSVVIDHGGGYYTVYAYLSEIQVRENQPVAKGDVVGLSGGENSEQGPHIEFQVRKEGQALDPIAWLRRRQ
ncbi:MAG: peptidoglycan DD-metalloendopeptidase family protein [Gemmatimonadales bacterium]|jgi:septal ring factor EnvC (AmiA/AmiB activator)